MIEPHPSANFDDRSQPCTSQPIDLQALLAQTRTRLFEALEANRVETISVIFEYVEGRCLIDRIDATHAGEAAELPLTFATVEIPSPGGMGTQIVSMTIREVIEHVVVAHVMDLGSEWSFEAGTYGEFIFEPVERALFLSCAERFDDEPALSYVFR